MILRRIVGNIIDIFVLLASVAGGVYLAAQLNSLFDETFTILLISQICVIILIPILLQSPFWAVSSTIGKSLTFCIVVDSNGKGLGYFEMLLREFLSKILSCYLVCIPVFFGKPGIHEKATDSYVMIKPKG